MLETVGNKLAKARESRHLSIEDVEHVTRIPHTRLRDLEEDDYSHFANLTYAKGFLKLYSDYLDVDTAEYRQELSLYEVDDFGDDPLAEAFADEQVPKRRPALFTAVVVLLLASLAGAYYYGEHYGKGKGDGGNDEGENPPFVAGEGELIPGAKPPGATPGKVPGDSGEKRPGDPEKPDGGDRKRPEPQPIIPAEVVEEGEGEDGESEAPLKAIPFRENDGD